MERRRATGTPLLLFDTGGTFLKSPGDALNAPLVDQTTASMVEGLGTIGYDALNLGRVDLLLPTELLRKIAAGAAFPLLSANIVDAAGQLAFKRWIVKEAGGLRVGILGLCGTQPPALAGLPGRDLTVLDPVEAARAALPELRRTSDLVVVLSQLGIEADTRLAGEAPGIDIILGGFDRRATPAPRFVGRTLIVHAGAKGMKLGRLGVQVRPGADGVWTARAAAHGGEARVYDWTVVPMDSSVPDHPALAALLERHNEEMRSRNIAAAAVAPPQTPAPGKPAYVGAAACGACHPAHLRQWSSSKHAAALDSLRRKRQEHNPECIRCHVTGFGDSGGYRGAAGGGSDMGNVQCEACHGFGREHRGPGNIRGVVPEGVCRRCHTTENSPTFKYEPYLKMLAPHAARYFERGKSRR